MPMKFLRALLSVFSLLFIAVAARANDKDTVSFDEQIKPIFRQQCVTCHGDAVQKANLNLSSYAAVLKGGGDKVVVAGRSSQSLLFKAIINPDDDARMPPNKPPLPKEQIALIQKWIDGGLRETAGGASLINQSDTSFKPVVEIGGKPAAPAMPENLAEVNAANAAASGDSGDGCQPVGSTGGGGRARTRAPHQHAVSGRSRATVFPRRRAAGHTF